MEVEREFMDALSVIISSDYYLEEDDFIKLIKSLKVSEQSTHAVERAKLLEFFIQAGELLEFNTELISRVL